MNRLHRMFSKSHNCNSINNGKNNCKNMPHNSSTVSQSKSHLNSYTLVPPLQSTITITHKMPWREINHGTSNSTSSSSRRTCSTHSTNNKRVHITII